MPEIPVEWTSWLYGMMAWFALAGLATLALTVLQITGRRMPTSAWLVGPLGMMIVAAVAGLATVGITDPNAPVTLNDGNPGAQWAGVLVLLGSGWAALLCMATAVFAALSFAINPGEGAKVTPLALIGPVALLVFGCVNVFFHFPSAMFAIVSGVALILVSARGSDEGDAGYHTASARLVVGAACVLAVLGIAMLAVPVGETLLTSGLAWFMSIPEGATDGAAASWSNETIPFAALSIGIAGITSIVLAPVAEHLASRRAAIGASVALVLGAVWFYVAQQTRDTVPPEVALALKVPEPSEWREKLGLDLAQSGPSRHTVFNDKGDVMVMVGNDAVWVDGVRASGLEVSSDGDLPELVAFLNTLEQSEAFQAEILDGTGEDLPPAEAPTPPPEPAPEPAATEAPEGDAPDAPQGEAPEDGEMAEPAPKPLPEFDYASALEIDLATLWSDVEPLVSSLQQTSFGGIGLATMDKDIYQLLGLAAVPPAPEPVAEGEEAPEEVLPRELDFDLDAIEVVVWSDAYQLRLRGADKERPDLVEFLQGAQMLDRVNAPTLRNNVPAMAGFLRLDRFVIRPAKDAQVQGMVRAIQSVETYENYTIEPVTDIEVPREDDPEGEGEAP